MNGIDAGKATVLTPLHDRVLIQPDAEADVTQGGIVIPEQAKEGPQRGTVKALGARVNGELKLGDVVLYGRYAGTHVTLDGVKMLMMKEEELIGVVT